MISLLRPCLVLLGLLTALTGLVYPALVTALAQGLFPRQANGSLLVSAQGAVVGSSLIGQPFDDERYFWGRPSATVVPYDASSSTGSNLGPSNPALREAIAARVTRLRRADPGSREPVPVDLVTASASGLDPHLSPAGVSYQVRRVARARGLPEATLGTLIDAHLEPRTLGFLGEPRVNVLRLNIALDELRR